MSVRVVVADDQLPFRRAARLVLCATPEFRLVGEATSGEGAIELVETLRPDLVLMDIAMAGIGGIEATRSITAAYPDTMTVLVSTYREDDLPREARACGAAAYVHKSDFGAALLAALWSSRPRRGRGSRPSRACEPMPPNPGRA